MLLNLQVDDLPNLLVKNRAMSEGLLHMNFHITPEGTSSASSIQLIHAHCSDLSSSTGLKLKDYRVIMGMGVPRAAFHQVHRSSHA